MSWGRPFSPQGRPKGESSLGEEGAQHSPPEAVHLWPRRRWLATAGAGLLLTACGRADPPTPAAPAKLSEADALAAIRAASLPDPDGRTEALRQWQGQPWLINFWATWCPPCVHEMPDLDQLQQAFPQVRFIGLGIDTADNMRQFRDRVPVAYPLLEARAQGLDWARALGNAAGGLPYTVLLDAQGRVRYRLAGRIDPEVLRQQLQAVV